MLKPSAGVKIRVLCDNSVRTGSRGILGEHGFSALVECGGERVLFDTGQTGTVILNNIKATDAGAKSAVAGAATVLQVALSHGHFDHTGGLLGLAESGMYKCAVHAHPDAFLRRYKKSRGRTDEISMPFSRERLQTVAEVIESKGPAMMNGWAMLTGEVVRSSFESPETEFFIERDGAILKDPFLDDQSMLINVESKGLVIITGCAHSGIINIIDHARKIAGVDRICAVIGGLHMVDYSTGKMEKTIELLKKRGPLMLMPCHCTGIEGIIALREGLGKSVKPCAAGMEIEF